MLFEFEINVETNPYHLKLTWEKEFHIRRKQTLTFLMTVVRVKCIMQGQTFVTIIMDSQRY